MSETTSNQNRAIATKGTSHVARTEGATDAHVDPENLADPRLFPNEVPMSLLTPGTSQTLVQGQPVWTAAHQVGPESGPAHPPFTRGAISGTYLQEAVATSYSPDLIAEGAGVVRSFDTTTQNHGNTTGFVDGGSLDATTTPDEAFLLRMCTLTDLQGVSDGRPLGYPGEQTSGRGHYLEILSGSEVVFTATRRDVTQEGAAIATCFRGGVHTQWSIIRAGLDGSESFMVEGTDAYTVDAGLTRLLFGNESNRLMPTPVVEAGGLRIETSGILNSIEAMLAFFRYRNSPVNIAVGAIACTASTGALLVVYPSQQIDLSISIGLHAEGDAPSPGAAGNIVAGIVNAIQTLRQVGDVVQAIGQFANRPVQCEFFGGAFFAFQGGYRVCSETRVGAFNKLYTPAHVGFPWQLTLGAETLVAFSAQLNISILNFIVPCLGQLAADALRWLGVGADVVFEAELHVGLSVSVGRDEYDFGTSPGCTLAISPTMSAGFDIAACVQWASLRVSFPSSLEVTFTLNDNPNFLMQLRLNGELRTQVSLTLLEDTWFEATYETDVDFLRVTWEGPTFDIIPTA